MHIRKSLSLFPVIFLATICFAGNPPGDVVIKEYDQYILTHLLIPAGPVPTAFDPNGVYPYISYSETSNRPVPKKNTGLLFWKMIL